jgi:hypothetical protein
MIPKNILFANLIQNTKELNLTIPWVRCNLKSDKKLYAKAEISNFILLAEYTTVKDTDFYGFMLSTKPKKLQVLPGVEEETEIFFECGFFENQKRGLSYYAELRDTFQRFSF